MAKRKNTRFPDVPVGPGVTAAAMAGAAAGGALAASRIARRAAANGEHQARERKFRLEPGERPGPGVRRIARGQLGLAADLLGGVNGSDLGKAVHSARKGLKRARALVRVARDPLGDEVYRSENASFRDIGRMLSGTRDAQVMVETLDALVERYAGEVPPGAFAGLRTALADEQTAAHDRLREDAYALGGIVAMLEEARSRVAHWPIEDGDDLRPLAPGLERIYRRGRVAYRAAEKDPGTEPLHDLRKRAKDLWHAAEILRPAAPKRMKKLAGGAEAVADAIGADHDLAVLLEGARARAGRLGPGELKLLTGLVARRRRRLQRKALRRAKRLYADKPRQVAARVR